MRKGEVDNLVADYGHLIVDECHHLSTVSFKAVARRCKARYVLGLSATVTRLCSDCQGRRAQSRSARNVLVLHGRDRELVYAGEADAGFGENRGTRGVGDCLAIFALDGTCLARIYHDAPVMKAPYGIGVDAEGNIYLTQVLSGNGPRIDPMHQQMMIRLRRA